MQYWCIKFKEVSEEEKLSASWEVPLAVKAYCSVTKGGFRVT